MFDIIVMSAAIAAAQPATCTDWQQENRLIDGEAGTIAVTVDYPADAGAVPFILVNGGSSYRVREEAAFAVQLLQPACMAIVRYDRRGHGESHGEAVIASTLNSPDIVPLLAGDGLRVVESLRADSDMPVSSFGLLGSSFGAWLNAEMASRSDNIDYFVSISAGAVSVGVSDHYDSLTDRGVAQHEALAQSRALASAPGYDPAAGLQNAEATGLFIFGLNDLSNPSQLEIERLQQPDLSAGDFTVIAIEDADHNLVRESTGAIAMEAMQDMVAWIREQDVARRAE
ncbi:alpha/beta hydrolase family protein [Hyphobacterium sp.]|uniref:alpha/beta hydrolase family protein n=1 Tax=Hyphobacterium sp. TaxID=2004662 RepID=UPI003BAAC63C